MRKFSCVANVPPKPSVVGSVRHVVKQALPRAANHRDDVRTLARGRPRLHDVFVDVARRHNHVDVRLFAFAELLEEFVAPLSIRGNPLHRHSGERTPLLQHLALRWLRNVGKSDAAIRNGFR